MPYLSILLPKIPDWFMLVSARNTHQKKPTPITYSGEGTGVGSGSFGAAVEVAGAEVTFSDTLLFPAAGKRKM